VTEPPEDTEAGAEGATGRRTADEPAAAPPSRRSLLGWGGAGRALGAAGAGGAVAAVHGEDTAEPAADSGAAVSFHGPHQAGIATAVQDRLHFASFDVTTEDRAVAFDISGTIPPDSWYGTLLKGVLNLQPDPTVLQVTVRCLYLIPTLALFLAPVGWRLGQWGQEAEAADEQAEKADSGDGGARDGGRSVADGERVRDGARGAGGSSVGEPE
jgi:hypothetical protein